VTKDHALVSGLALRVSKPGQKTSGTLSDRALEAPVEPPVRGAHAHAREVAQDHARPQRRGQRLRQLVRLHVAGGRQARQARRLEPTSSFLGKLQRLSELPLRRNAGMHHAVAEGLIHVQQRLLGQPCEQLRAIRRAEHGSQRVAGARLPRAGRDRQEMHFVISEHQLSGCAESAHEAQHFERLWPPIHHVAHQPQLVSAGSEAHLAKHTAQRRIAPLDVTNRVHCHRGILAPGSRSSVC
jgi:hypothetical protein